MGVLKNKQILIRFKYQDAIDNSTLWQNQILVSLGPDPLIQFLRCKRGNPVSKIIFLGPADLSLASRNGGEPGSLDPSPRSSTDSLEIFIKFVFPVLTTAMRGNKTFTNLLGALVLDDREKHVPRVADCYLFYDDNRPQGTCFKPHFIDRLVFQLATGINISVKLNSRAVIKNKVQHWV